MSGLQNLTLENDFFKVLHVTFLKVKNVDPLVLTFKVPNLYEYTFICDDLHIGVLCSLDMQFNKHAVVLLHGRDRWEMPLIHFFPRKSAFPTMC